MLSLVAINIVSKDDILGQTLINKNGVPVVLYTHDPDTTIGELSDKSTDVGKTMHTFIVNNIVRPTYNSKEGQLNLYTYSDIVYIYYNPDTKYNRQGHISIQDMFKLDINSNDADVFYLSLYYIRKAVKDAIKLMKLHRMRSYDISDIVTKDKLDRLYNMIREKYSPDILVEFKNSLKSSLYNIGVSKENVERIIL